MVFKNFFTYRQPDASAFVLAAAEEPLKNCEILTVVFFLKTDSVIGDLDLVVSVAFGERKFLNVGRFKISMFYFNYRLHAFAYKFQRIAQQVLKQLPEL